MGFRFEGEGLSVAFISLRFAFCFFGGAALSLFFVRFFFGKGGRGKGEGGGRRGFEGGEGGRVRGPGVWVNGKGRKRG